MRLRRYRDAPLAVYHVRQVRKGRSNRVLPQVAQAALAATRRTHKPVTASHLMHAPPEQFTRWVNDILNGTRGLAGGA